MKIFLLTFWLLFFSVIGFAEEAKLKGIIENTYPELIVKSVTKTEFNELYEVYIGGQIIYTDKNFNFLIVEGRIVDPSTKKDMTSERLEVLTLVDFKALPFKYAIKDVRGSGKSKIAVFSDIDCPFCRRLEKQALAKLTDATIYTFLYPLAIHPEAEKKSKKIWCSENPTLAWSEFMLKNKLPENQGNCETPIKEISILAKELGVSSTPTIIFSSGKRVEGAIPYSDLVKYLDNK